MQRGLIGAANATCGGAATWPVISCGFLSPSQGHWAYPLCAKTPIVANLGVGSAHVLAPLLSHTAISPTPRWDQA